ncbi:MULTISPECIES: UbiD family decarboxylase [Acidianus]|uniref:3-octaprenyl-4-hydroxybenzoate carboxy-lyase n=1 Tax=Candidatus Acidianus copahuensis TaxID=1160895 RepID=A0A031LMI4_9CREN|nr:MULTISPECIES: UbiD family decarboxylase [Acidianus]EZQ06833.1 hypothetical protein CM19_05525 [Candidatus Acidianus copahuensis]NON61490.1 UbiD family decarboxylase [Acidianus sp. RZ1]
MTFQDLRDYINFMSKSGKIIKIDDEVDVNLEIAEISRRATYLHLPPVLFTKVRGYKEWRVISNVFYSIQSVKEILGTQNLEDIGKRFLSSFSETPLTFMDKVKSLPSLLKLGKISPKMGKLKPKESNIKLTDIPAIKTWPKDISPYFTFSLVVTRDPETGVNNLGVYRIQILNEKEAIVHWQAFKRGSLASAKYKEKGITKMPIAIVNGVDPVIAFTAASPVPPGIDKYLFSGILREEGVEVTELDNGILVPSNAESILEGYVDLEDQRLEGPFGDHFGYYTPPAYFPVFKLEKAYIRESPIFHVTSVGKPPLEDAWIGKAVERIFLPFIKLIIPDIVDMNLPEYGLFTQIGFFSMRKNYPGQAKRLMMSVWGSGQLSFLKFIVIVDSDVNIHDLNQVLYAIATTVDPVRDVIIIPGTMNDSLDQASLNPPLGSKIGIDATRKFKEELGRDWPEEVSVPDEIQKKAIEIIKRITQSLPPS